MVGRGRPGRPAWRPCNKPYRSTTQHCTCRRYDKALDYIDTHLADEGVGLRWLARHVETKAARMLAEQPVRHTVLVLDRQVCGRDDVTRDYPYMCDEYLPTMIPRGSALTVIEVDGTHVTYEGTGTR